MPTYPADRCDIPMFQGLGSGIRLEAGLAEAVRGSVTARLNKGMGHAMRMHLMSIAFSALMAVLATPAALSASPKADTETPVAAAQPVAVQRVAVPSAGLRDEAAMVLVGTALIGLAAVVRRAAA